MSVAVVLVAAGSGQRLGAGQPKALVPLRDRTILDWAVQAFSTHPEIDQLVVVGPAASTESIASALPAGARVVPGGSTRRESVNRGLAALDEDVEFVLVHDAARPLVPASVISAVVEGLRAGADAVIPVLPVTDTIKLVDAGDRVLATVERSELRRVQTPQGFRLSVLRAAHDSVPAGDVTDDAGLLERLGHQVQTVAGDEEAFKITTAHDLLLADLLLGRRA